MSLDLTDARALTLYNPWGWAVTHAGKRHENRMKPPPRNLRRILIHAGVRWDRDAETFISRLGYELPALDTITTAAIVAVADLAGVCDATVGDPRASCRCGPWAMPGHFHWRLADRIHVLPTPVPCKGAQGTWLPPAGVMAAVGGQFA